MRRPVRSRAPVPWQRWQYRQARPDGERCRPAPPHLRQAANGQTSARRDVTESDDEQGRMRALAAMRVGVQDGLRGRFQGVAAA